MSYHSREAFIRSLNNDREDPPENTKKNKRTAEERKQFEEEWREYKKTHAKKNERKYCKGWDYDEDDDER